MDSMVGREGVSGRGFFFRGGGGGKMEKGGSNVCTVGGINAKGLGTVV